ncbi:S24 family peptidase [Photobacterium ganghwense]|nr:S24 family peptidase [Photobacterium ganghwense]
MLGCSPEWLLNGENEPDNNVSPGPCIRGQYPLISWVQAGTWSSIYEEPLINAVRYPCPVACSDKTFVLRVQGISMEPRFSEGDLIFVDPEAEVKSKKFVVARLDDSDEATFKQIIIEGDLKFLRPVNPNWPEQLIPINGNCTIVGVVVFAGVAL